MNDQILYSTVQRGRLRARYDNFIGGKWQAPVKGRYFSDPSPVDGTKLCDIARSDAADVELALDAAHAARDAWGRTSPAERGRMLLKIADRIEENLEFLAYAETLDNGKPIRETTPPTFRWPPTTSAISPAASAPRKARSQKSTTPPSPIISRSRWASSRQIIPWNFPLLMAAWKMAPALAAGNCVGDQARLRHAAVILRADGPDRRHPAARAC